jgi:hypothetical protein
VNNARRIYPFTAICPLCGGQVDGLVDGESCLDGGGAFAEKVSGLIHHRCNCCGKSIGLRLRLKTDGVEVFESGPYTAMLVSDYATVLQKKKRG